MFENEFALINPAKRVRIELHWRFFREKRSIEMILRNGWRENRSAFASDSGLPCLKGVLSFAYLVMHGAQHGFYAAQWLVDVVAQWRALGEAERAEARFLVAKHALEKELGLAGRMAKDLFGVDPEDEDWPKARRAPAFAVAFAMARLKAADPLARIDTLWHVRNLRFQLALAGTWRECRSLLFFSSVTTPSLFRHRLPSFLVFLHPLLRLLDFPTSRLLSAFRAGTQDSVNRAPRLSIYDPWFLREIVTGVGACRRKSARSGGQADPQMGGFSCPSSSSIPFHRVGLLPRADGSPPRTARFLFPPVEAYLPAPLFDTMLGVAALRRQEHLGNSTWHAHTFWSTRISRMARAR